MTESTVSEGIMDRISKLLERANHPETPPHEAKLAEEMAEKLMAKHMVDRFEAEAAAKARGETVRKPVCEDWVVRNNYVGEDGQGNEFTGIITGIMRNVLEHCNVRMNHNYSHPTKVVGEDFGVERKSTDYSTRVYQIVGFPEDIAYAERIWFNIFKTFVQNVNPQWLLDQSVELNAYTFASAGVSWKQQVLIAEKAGDERIEKPWRYQGEDRNAPFYSSFQAGSLIDPGNEAWGRSIHKLKRACKKYCTEHKVDYPYGGGVKLRTATRASFAQSFDSTIRNRLYEIRKLAESDSQIGKDKFALAIRDTKDRVDEEFYRLFPEFDPEVRRKKVEEQEWLRAVAFASLSPEEQQRVIEDALREEASYQRRAARARRNYRTVRSNNTMRVDEAAWERGRRAAESVNLRNDGEVKNKTKKEIG